MTLFDLFNEAETVQQPFVAEPGEVILVKEHKKRKAKCFEKLCLLPVETIEYTFGEEERTCEICVSGATNTVVQKSNP